MTEFSRHALGRESQNLMDTPCVQVLDMRTSWGCGELGSIRQNRHSPLIVADDGRSGRSTSITDLINSVLKLFKGVRKRDHFRVYSYMPSQIFPCALNFDVFEFRDIFLKPIGYGLADEIGQCNA
jgi:hypothetical protein